MANFELTFRGYAILPVPGAHNTVLHVTTPTHLGILCGIYDLHGLSVADRETYVAFLFEIYKRFIALGADPWPDR